MIYGNSKYSYSGKRRKTSAFTKSKKITKEFKPLQTTTNVLYEESCRVHDSIPSNKSMADCTQSTKSTEKAEVSSKYTVAPAYNKGGYQVIPKDCVKDIGR